LALIRGGKDDVDIDVGVFGPLDIVLKAFMDEGAVYEHGFGIPECGHQYSVILDGVKVDLFRVYAGARRRAREEMLWSAAWVGNTSADALCEMVVYEYSRFVPIPHTLINTWGYVPSILEAFCIEQYGPEWRTPIEAKDWNYAEDAKNARHSGVYCRQTLVCPCE
jgi:hypothetical protein